MIHIHNADDLRIGETINPKEVMEESFPVGSGLEDGWDRLSHEWPMARTIVHKLIKYLGAELCTAEGPLVVSIIGKSTTRYLEAHAKRDYERLYEFVLGVADNIRWLPNVRLNCDKDFWIMGEHCDLSKWLRHHNRLKISITLLEPALSAEKARNILGYIVDRNVVNWLDSTVNKIVRIVA